MEFCQEPLFAGALVVVSLALAVGCVWLFFENKQLRKEIETPRKIYIRRQEGMYVAYRWLGCRMAQGFGQTVILALGNFLYLYTGSLNFELEMDSEACSHHVQELTHSI